MEISKVEIHEFEYVLSDVGSHNGHQIFEPGSEVGLPGFVLTIRSDTGVEGHYRGFSYAPPMITQIEMAAPEFLIGRDPLKREGIWQDIWKAFRHTDRLGLGPIDIALWDLAGEYHQESVSTLLGGYRDAVPAYASTYWSDDADGGLNTPESYADFAEDCLESGYPAFKIHPTGDPDRDVQICRTVAERVGNEMGLMLDPASEYETYLDTLRVGRVLDELGYVWYEDPMADTGESMHMGKKLARELDTPILGAEHVRTGPAGRADHVMADALDLVRADAHQDGGITSVMKIAHLAEACGVDVELHMGGPAHLHCLSAIRNTNYYEHGLLHPEAEWTGSKGFRSEVDTLSSDGTVPIPNGPGLGVDIDWSYVEDTQTGHTCIEGAGVSGLS